MIQLIRGNLLEDKSEAIVNTVNCVGVMGKGIALPPLGCGYGGLDWNDVRKRIETAFHGMPDVEVHLYVP